MFTFPYVVTASLKQGWGFSYKRYLLMVSEDTSAPYSILHLGPVEMFIRPKSVALDFI
jgi:hypothetical protein